MPLKISPSGLTRKGKQLVAKSEPDYWTPKISYIEAKLRTSQSKAAWLGEKFWLCCPRAPSVTLSVAPNRGVLGFLPGSFWSPDLFLLTLSSSFLDFLRIALRKTNKHTTKPNKTPESPPKTHHKPEHLSSPTKYISSPSDFVWAIWCRSIADRHWWSRRTMD